MMKHYALPLLALLFTSAAPSEAQNPGWSWARRDGNVTYNVNPAYPRQVVAAAPNRVLWGTIQNRKMLYNTQLGDYRVAEMDSSGAQVASVNITGKLSLLQASSDAAGNWYILGTVYDSIQVGSNPLVVRNPASSDRFLMRLHAGTLAQDWFVMVGNDFNCTTESFTLSSNAVTLSVDSALSSHISDYNLTTGARTTRIRQATRSYVSSVSRDASGGTFVLGTCPSGIDIDFNGTTVQLPLNLSYPWYLVYYDASGAHKWHYFLNDITCTQRALTPADANSVYLSGDLLDSAQLGSYHLAKAPEGDYVVARIANDGSISWVGQRPVTGATQGRVEFGGPAKALAADSLLVVAPDAYGPNTWSAGGVTTSNTSLNGTVVGYGGAGGKAVWARAIAADYSTIQHIATDGAAVYVTGVGSDLSAMSFDNVSVSTTAVPGKYVPFLAKLNLSQSSLEVDETSMVPPALYAFPNPASTSLSVYAYRSGAARIVDALGRPVWTGTLQVKDPTVIDVAGWPRGMYVLQQPGLGRDGVLKLILR